MFEVVVIKSDGMKLIYDGLEEMQAQCIFFLERMKSKTESVELNEYF